MIKDSITTYLNKHATGYELDATRCAEAAQEIYDLREKVCDLENTVAFLTARLQTSEADRFQSYLKTERRYL